MSIGLDPFLYQRLARFDLVSVLHFVNSEQNAKRMSENERMSMICTSPIVQEYSKRGVKNSVQNVHNCKQFICFHYEIQAILLLEYHEQGIKIKMRLYIYYQHTLHRLMFQI